MTDVLGNLLAVKVHRANLHDTKAGIFPAVSAYLRYPTIQKYCGDKGYRKTFVVRLKLKRWVVERTFEWLNNSLRLAKDFEIKTIVSENFIKISHFHTLLKRL